MHLSLPCWYPEHIRVFKGIERAGLQDCAVVFATLDMGAFIAAPRVINSAQRQIGLPGADPSCRLAAFMPIASDRREAAGGEQLATVWVVCHFWPFAPEMPRGAGYERNVIAENSRVNKKMLARTIFLPYIGSVNQGESEMKPETYVSGPHKQRNGKFRVAVKRFSGNLNTLDATYAEAQFRTESAAEIQANKWASEYSARRTALKGEVT